MKKFAILTGISILSAMSFLFFALNHENLDLDKEILYVIEGSCALLSALLFTLGLSAYGKYIEDTNDVARRSFELFGEEIHGKMSLFIDDTIKLNKDYNDKFYNNLQERQKALDDLNHKDVELLRELLMLSSGGNDER
jgi:hypothetical protein